MTSEAAASSSSSSPSLVRGLSFLDSVLLLVGGIVGSGIFLTAGQVAGELRLPVAFLLVWPLGALISLLACFAMAELGTMYPQSGGPYVYLREAYGDLAAFLYGWMIFTVSVPGTVAALAVGFAQYLDAFVAYGAAAPLVKLGGFAITRAHVVSLLAIGFVTSINVLGVKRGAYLQNAATWAKALAIAAFVVLGLLWGEGTTEHLRAIAGVRPPDVVELGVALIAVFWAFDGWVYITWVAGEVKEPQRTLPRALVSGIGLVAVLYTAINLVYLYALPIAQVAQEESIAASAAAALFTPRAGEWMALLVAVSCFGALSVAVLAGARVYFAMARDGLFFRKTAEVHPRWHTPAFSLVVQGVWAALLALSGRYDQLFTYVMVMMVISYVASVGALFVLRQQQPERARPYRCTGYPWTAGAYIVIASAFTANAALQRPWESLAGAGIVLAGVPAFLAWRKRNRALTPAGR